MTSTSTRDHLHQGRTATPCPVWCITDHDTVDEIEGPAGHESAKERVIDRDRGQPVALGLDIPGALPAEGRPPQVYIGDFVGGLDLDQLDLAIRRLRGLAHGLSRSTPLRDRMSPSG